jgi:hypothetical protein
MLSGANAFEISDIERMNIRVVLRKNSMDDIDPSFECSAFCSLLPGVSLVGTAA